MALFSLGYYGLFRIGELCVTGSVVNHTIKAHDIHLAHNKEKILVVLHSSKTHGLESRSQKVKITSNRSERSGQYSHRNFCPFKLVRHYINMRSQFYDSADQPFFIYSDGSPLKATTVQFTLKKLIAALGLDSSLYAMHSFRIGRASDLIKYGYSLEEVKSCGKMAVQCRV